MKKAVLDKLTGALEGAGFEVVSLKEETYRHALLEHDAGGTLSVEGPGAISNEPTGAILLEVRLSRSASDAD
jgi:hypothetical protein